MDEIKLTIPKREHNSAKFCIESASTRLQDVTNDIKDDIQAPHVDVSVHITNYFSRQNSKTFRRSLSFE